MEQLNNKAIAFREAIKNNPTALNDLIGIISKNETISDNIISYMFQKEVFVVNNTENQTLREGMTVFIPFKLLPATTRKELFNLGYIVAGLLPITITKLHPMTQTLEWSFKGRNKKGLVILLENNTSFRDVHLIPLL